MTYGCLLLHSGEAGQEPVQFIGECLLIPLTECGRTARHLNTAGTHRVQKVAHVQARTDIFGRMHFAAWAECVAAFFYDLCRQRNVTRNDEVAGLQAFDDFIVSDIEAPGYLQSLDVGRGGRWQWLIGDQRELHPGSRGCAKQDFLDYDRTGVRVDPYFHQHRYTRLCW